MITIYERSPNFLGQLSPTVQMRRTFDSYSEQVQKSREKFRRSASTVSYRCVKASPALVPSSIPLKSDTITSISTLTRFKLQATFLQKSHNYELNWWRHSLLSFIVGRPRGGRLNKLNGKKERDGSNWIHRFLRN